MFSADIRNGKGSLGKFLVDEDAYKHLDSIAREPG